METVAVVVPTYRRKAALDKLLESIFASTRLPDEVIVVDNDPTVSLTADWPSEWRIQLIQSGLGLNLAGARNRGWRSSQSDLCVFIDDDNSVAQETIANLLEASQSLTVGLVGPIIYEADNPTRIWCGGVQRSMWTARTRFLCRGLSHLPSDSTWPTAEMPDAFAVPRETLEQVGGFDEIRFPFHYDEADLGQRVRRLGLRTIVTKSASAWHSGGTATDPGVEMWRAHDLGGPRRIERMVYARVAFHRLYSTDLQRLVVLGIFIPLYGLILAVACLRIRRQLTPYSEVLRGIFGGLAKGYFGAL